MRKLCIALAFIVLLSCMPVRAKAQSPETSAQAAAVLEIGTNTVLYAKNAHEKLPMASTTKVMTALIAIERGNLDEVFPVCDEAYGVEGSSMYLLKNERISLRDLLYGLMLRSGNDAAVAIAYRIGGGIAEFADLMNRRARELGAVNTHFVTPHGLPADDHYTTAYDLALICSYAMKNPTFREIAATQYHKAQTGEVERTMMNKNKLLFQYEGAQGIKTGYTKAAGKCLTFSAKRENMEIAGVVLNCPDMFTDSMKLMDYCFDTYVMYTVVKKGTPVIRTEVINGRTLASLVTAQDVTVPVRKSEGIRLTSRITLSDNITAPLKKGDAVGYLSLYTSAGLTACVPLVSDTYVAPYGYEHYLFTFIRQYLL